MRPSSAGQTARDVRKSTRDWRAAVAAKLELPQAEIERRTKALVDEFFAREAKRAGNSKPATYDDKCIGCGFDPKHAHGAIMVGDVCSQCWRKSA